MALVLILGATAVAAVAFGDRLSGWAATWLPASEPPAPEWLEARVRTEPPGLPVRYEGRSLEDPRLRFPARPPHGVLTAELGCRRIEHALEAADAGTEIVLVADPVEAEVQISPGVRGASVRVNGESAGTTPATVELDLCRANAIELRAEGYVARTVEIPEGATPLEARTAVADVGLERIPEGRLVLPATDPQMRFYVDGRRASTGGDGMRLAAGEYRVRAVNDQYWIDVTYTVDVPAGETVTAPVQPPPLAVLAVQAFPPNCKVYLRRPGGSWVYLDTTPVRRSIAVGRYEVRAQFVPTGETQERAVRLRAGAADPVRFSFARRG